MKHMITFLIFLMLIAACAPAAQYTPSTQPTPSPQSPPDPKSAEAAQQTLVNFFNLLNSGRFDEVDYYFPPYQYAAMIEMNPDLEPNDSIALWKAACEVNGYQCLTVRSAVVKEHYADTYIFLVEFNNPDGSLFVKGPCCGANETDQPPVSQFEYHLSWIEEDGPRFLIMEPPVYVP